MSAVKQLLLFALLAIWPLLFDNGTVLCLTKSGIPDGRVPTPAEFSAFRHEPSVVSGLFTPSAAAEHENAAKLSRSSNQRSLPQFLEDRAEVPQLPTPLDQRDDGIGNALVAVSYQLQYEFEKAPEAAQSGHLALSPWHTQKLINKGRNSDTSLLDVYRSLVHFGTAFVRKEAAPSTGLLEWPQSVCEWHEAQRNRAAAVGIIEDLDDDQGIFDVRASIAMGKPVAIVSHINGWQERVIKERPEYPYKRDLGKRVVSHCTEPRSDGDAHSLLIVGYDDNVWADVNQDDEVQDGEVGAFKLLNTWGREWGNGGYTWVAYDAFRARSRAGPRFARIPLAVHNAAFWLAYADSYAPAVRLDLGVDVERRSDLRQILGELMITDTERRVQEAQLDLAAYAELWRDDHLPFYGELSFDLTPGLANENVENRRHSIQFLGNWRHFVLYNGTLTYMSRGKPTRRFAIHPGVKLPKIMHDKKKLLLSPV